jgi:hypothetical protein
MTDVVSAGRFCVSYRRGNSALPELARRFRPVWAKALAQSSPQHGWLALQMRHELGKTWQPIVQRARHATPMQSIANRQKVRQ